MTDFNLLEKEFNTYNPLIFDLDFIDKTNILESNFDIQFSNNICFPEVRLGFHHFIHQAKDKMEAVEDFSNRKKIYLVTSLFEKNIDYKEKTDSGIEFTSIDNGIKSFIKTINPNFPSILNRAFLKLWEILVIFDLIPETDNFVSSHLAEGPGSFIQATILYRDMLSKLGKIKSSEKDNFYGVTLHSDHEHLLMHEEFIKYFSKEKNQRLHIMETKSIKEIKDLYGGGKHNKSITNGDLTKLNTIKQFAGGKDVESFAKPSDLITADGGFDWKRENLQEQEAYKLIFSEIITALKIQKNGGNFVIKIFESYTKITIKIIQLLRQFYKKVYISKPYSSRISNSEKYLICKDFNKSIVTSAIIKKLEDLINSINKNEQYQIIDMFTEINLNDSIYECYKTINSELLVKQYVGINNIIKFINLDNYNGIEFNEYLDKQVTAAYFWNNLFLNSKNYSKINKFFNKFNYLNYKKTLENKEEESNNVSKDSEQSEQSEKQNLNKKISRSKIPKNKTPKGKISKSNSKKIVESQKGGGKNETSDLDIIIDYDDNSINSSDEVIGKLDSDSESGIIDLNNIYF